MLLASLARERTHKPEFGQAMCFQLSYRVRTLEDLNTLKLTKWKVILILIEYEQNKMGLWRGWVKESGETISHISRD